jgi:hypothetical protein
VQAQKVARGVRGGIMGIMDALTISKKITKGEELVVIPRKMYDRFLAVYEKRGWSMKEREANEDIMVGRISRGYRTKAELKVALNRLKK